MYYFLNSRCVMLNDTKLVIKQALKRAHTQKAVHSIDSILNGLHVEFRKQPALNPGHFTLTSHKQRG